MKITASRPVKRPAALTKAPRLFGFCTCMTDVFMGRITNPNCPRHGE